MKGRGLMLTADEVETLNADIQQMNREAVARQLQTFDACFPLDFTPEFFATQPLDRLRHILFGLCLHTQKRIEPAAA